MNYRELGFTVSKYRKLKGLNQVELAKYSGISRNYISMIERGRVKNLAIEKIVTLAKVLGISAYVLLKALLGDWDERDKKNQ